MKAYICGPTSGDFKLSMEAFQINAVMAREVLSTSVGTPYDLFEGVSVQSAADEFKIEVAELLNCQFLIMAGSWGTCEKCILLRRIAQFLGIIIYKAEQLPLIKKS